MLSSLMDMSPTPWKMCVIFLNFLNVVEKKVIETPGDENPEGFYHNSCMKGLKCASKGQGTNYFDDKSNVIMNK